MHGRVEGRDGSRETDTPARDVSVGSCVLCVCDMYARCVPWKIVENIRPQ